VCGGLRLETVANPRQRRSFKLVLTVLYPRTADEHYARRWRTTMPRRVDAADALRISGGGATVGYHQPQGVPPRAPWSERASDE
jgi:hypothetical protein